MPWFCRVCLYDRTRAGRTFVKAWMPMNPSGAPILVIDSGLGGFTCVKAVHALLPHEQIVYFGDTARLPYGSKSAATVTTFVKQIIAYMRGGGAMDGEPKHVLIACNTATAMARPAL